MNTIIRTLAFTGMQRGEALALKWKNIDLTNGTITIEGTRDEISYRTPKTKNSYRTIAIDESLIRLSLCIVWGQDWGNVLSKCRSSLVPQRFIKKVNIFG
ncbi:site-specific integrase [Lysinibacillus mangiferihumi]|uniref:hypothetical protein n=1 Tax=Lysinibacillus mangiferihumi TaxID=1130819 RepID=UPI00142E2916